jgi:hypothetical protein
MDVTVWDYAESGLAKANKLVRKLGVDITTEMVNLNEVKWKTKRWDGLVCIFIAFS